MRIRKTIAIVTLLAATFITAQASTSTMPRPPRHHRLGDGITFQVFYDDLSSYGEWINYPEYGYVWRPFGVAGDFQPYFTDGRWLCTDAGFAWSSDFAWGWAPFHYGTWLYDDFYGWVWVPGYEWAPAWVTWGFYDGYYGWAPLTPFVGASFNYNTYRPHDHYWHFVPAGNVFDYDLHRSAVYNRNDINRLSEHISIVDNRAKAGRFEYQRGPNVSDVERYTNRHVVPTRIVDTSKPGRTLERREEFSAYRPKIEERSNETAAPRPKEFRSAEQTHPIRSGSDRMTQMRPSQPEWNRERAGSRNQNETSRPSSNSRGGRGRNNG